jgi:GH24 family phage-related lysozyme (muramidase)
VAITYSNAIQDFGNTLYRVIRWLEEKGGVLHQTVYTDGKGYATIGAGFLISKDNLPAILRNMGLAENLITQATTKIAAAVTLNGKPRSFSTDAAALQAISNALHEVSAGANFAYSNVTATSDAQIRQTFDDILPRYTGTVATFVANVSAANKPASNREYLALLSLAYNGMLGKNDKGNLISPSLQQALIDGDRAEAWFQIRYGSNPDNLPGFAKRRYFESSLFSLYADPSNPSDEEVKQAYRMLQLHRTKIVDYEKRHGYWTDTVGTVAGTTRDANGRLGLDAANGADYVGILGFLPRGHAEFAIEAFDPAKQRLFAMIPELSGFNPADYLATNIYLDPSRDRAVDPMTGSAVPVDNEHRGYLNATTYNSQGNEIASNDILIGEGGIDYLRGGKGDDILMGGTGRDVYLYKLGDGNDRIIDSDGGFLIISSATGASDSFQLYATGAFVKTGQDTWTRTEGQHTITLSHNSPWTLTLEDGATIDLGESFNPDSFGIDLVEATTGGTLIKGDLDPILDGNGDLQYDADGNVVVNAAIAAPAASTRSTAPPAPTPSAPLPATTSSKPAAATTWSKAAAATTSSPARTAPTPSGATPL